MKLHMQQFGKRSQEIACQIMTFYDAKRERANGNPCMFACLSHSEGFDEVHKQAMSRPCEAYPWFQQPQQEQGQQASHQLDELYHQSSITYIYRCHLEGVQNVVYLGGGKETDKYERRKQIKNNFCKNQTLLLCTNFKSLKKTDAHPL